MAGPDSLVGQSLSNTYRVVRQIAQGGMGAIYEASHVRLIGKRYAIKVLTPRYANQPDVLERFRREAEITTQLGHEHIIEVHDFNVVGDVAYLAMELLEGEDLAARIKGRGVLALDVVARIVEQVASALDAAHRARIVHRDLKPQNIFLCRRAGRDDYVKVLDFGVSKVLDSSLALTQQDALVGTPYYMAPEQAEGKIDEIDARTDVFALGAIAWEMLTGKRAFGGPTLSAALYNVCLVDPPDVHQLRPEVAPAASLVLRRALAKDRAVRTASAVVLARELAAALSVAPPPVRAQPRGFANTELSGGMRVSPETMASRAAPRREGGGAVATPGAVATSGTVASGVRLAWTPGQAAAVASDGAAESAGSAHPGAMADGSFIARPRPRRRTALIAATAAGVIAVFAAVWGMARSPAVATEHAAPPPPVSVAAPAPQPPAPAPIATPPRDEVALAFTVEPAGARVELRLDGEPLLERLIRRPRSHAPIVVTATAAGYLPFRSEITADKDQTVSVALRLASPALPHATRVRRVAPEPAAATPPRPVPAASALTPPQPATAAAGSGAPAARPATVPYPAPAPSPATVKAYPAPAPYRPVPMPYPAPPPYSPGAPPAPVQAQPVPVPPVQTPAETPPAKPTKKTGTVFDQ